MNYPVNRSDFIVTKRFTTEIHFFIKNVDRQAVQLTTPPRIIITDLKNKKVLLDRSLTLVTAPTALWKLTIEPEDMNDWPLGYHQYCMVSDRADGSSVLLYTDKGYGPYSQLEVIQGPYPLPAPEIVVTPDMFTIDSGTYISGAFPGPAAVANLSGVSSVVASLSAFRGVVGVQASLEVQPTADSNDWFLVKEETFPLIQPAANGNYYIETIGNFLWVRFVYRVFEGEVEKITFRNN